MAAGRRRDWPGLAVAALIVWVLTQTGGLHTTPHPAPAPAPAPAAAGYVNPLTGGRWVRDRIDQGIDYKPAGPVPVRAIGEGTVIYSSRTDCPPDGWPACHVIGYRLATGRAAGAVVFVAEHLTGLARAGTVIRHPGQVIGTALPGWPYTEWGWGNCRGAGPVATYSGAPDGTDMAGGLAFARFMAGLGASPPPDANAENPGPGPDVIKPPACRR